MPPIHVAFAAKSVALLRKRPTLIGPESIAEWNKDHANGLPKKGRGASGRADNLFNSGYFLMPQLQRMARGELPLPISKKEPDSADATVRRREGARAGADGADATARGRHREGARAGEDGADATRRGHHLEGARAGADANVRQQEGGADDRLGQGAADGMQKMCGGFAELVVADAQVAQEASSPASERGVNHT